MNLIGTKLNFKREQGKLVQRLFSLKSHYYTTQRKQWKHWKQMLSRRFPSMAFCITTTALSLRSPPPTKILTLTNYQNKISKPLLKQIFHHSIKTKPAFQNKPRVSFLLFNISKAATTKSSNYM